MAETASFPLRRGTPRQAAARTASPLVRWSLIFICLVFLGLFLLLPLVAVFANALSRGFQVYLRALSDPDALSAIRLTPTLIKMSPRPGSVSGFGLAASWSIAKFDFVGKQLLITLIDIPVSVSPVISGMVFILLFGAQGLFGRWLIDHNIRIVFAVPGLILAVLTFVTFPYIARELIPTMLPWAARRRSQPPRLGAGGWHIFWRVTLPNIKWSLLYGVIICNARAISEFWGRSRSSPDTFMASPDYPCRSMSRFFTMTHQFAAAFAAGSPR